MSVKQLIRAVAATAVLLVTLPAVGETYYFHNDHLGTPQALTDDSGTVVWQGNYSPFGEVTETIDTVEQNIRFPGQYFEEETGLHYNYFRDYDPTTGRYIESDPIGLDGGVNTFGYGYQNSVSNFDIFGLEVIGRYIKSPSWSDFSFSVTDFEFDWLNEAVGDIDYSASAKVHWIIGCVDTCTDESWTLDSGEREFGTSGTISTPTPSSLPCLGFSTWQKAACRLASAAKLSAAFRQISESQAVEIYKFASSHFDAIAQVYAEAVDPTNWCKLYR